MSWREALEREVARTGNARYRMLCADDHPRREDWRRIVVEKDARRAEMPSLLTMAGNAAKAAGRVLAAAAKGEPIKVPASVYHERLEICRPCEFNRDRPSGVKCSRCGCGGLKLELATEECPLDPPRWTRRGA